MSAVSSARVLKVLAFCFGTFALWCGLIGCLYVRAIGTGCANHICTPEPTFWPNGVFYAAQTITTTGYGTGVAVHLEDVQVLSNFVMPITALYWGIVIAIAFEALRKNPDAPAPRA